MHSPTVWIKRLAVFLCAATLLILIPALNGRAQKLQSLSGQKVLIVRGDHDYPPYEFMKNGKPAGFNIDLIRAVAKELNLKIKIDLGPWNEVRQELEDGKIDILSGMYYSGDRDKQVDFSVPHVFISYALFVRDDSDISSLQDLSGKDVLVQKGDLANDLLKEREETVNIIPVPDISDVLQILSAGEYDCALLPRIQGLYFIRQQHLSNLRNIHINFPLQPYCFAVREGNESLLHALNEGLNIVKSTGEYQHIYRKWFGLFEKKSFWETYRTLIISFSIFLVILFFATMWVWSLRRQVHIRTARQLKTEERYSLLFHRIPVGVFHYDTDLVITDFNGRFSEILQSDSHSLQNLQMDKLKDKRVLPAISAVLHGKEGIYEGPYDTTTSSVIIYRRRSQ